MTFFKRLLEILRALFSKPSPSLPEPEPAPEDSPVVDLPPETPPDPKPLPVTLGEAAMIVAREKVGEKEKTGQNDGPFVEMIQDWMDGPNSEWADALPWCAMFASWCIYQGSERFKLPRKFIKSASSTEIYARAKKDGTLLKKPEGFCIGLVKGNGGTPGKTHHHTFLANATVPAPIPGHVWSVDGNYRDSVMRTTHKISDCDFVRIE